MNRRIVQFLVAGGVLAALFSLVQSEPPTRAQTTLERPTMTEITSVRKVNARVLAWEIRKTLGLNLGGYNETNDVPQTGSISTSALDGVSIELPSGASPSVVTLIQAILDSHNPDAPAPADFPADPTLSLSLDEVRHARLQELRDKGIIGRSRTESNEALQLLLDNLDL